LRGFKHTEQLFFSAINNAQLQVTFNKEVDKTTAQTLTNYTLTKTAGTAVLTGGSATLQADGKTVILDLATAGTNQDKIKLAVKDVKDTAGAKVEAVTKDVQFFDVTLPVAEKVEVTGTKTLKVTFSEPVDVTASAGATFKIDNGVYSAPTASFGTGINRNEVTLTLAAALPNGEHTLTVEGVKDYAGFASASKNLSFTFATDTSAPTVSIKEVKPDAKTVVLKFSKDVSSATLVNNAQVELSHTYKGTNTVTGAAVTRVSDSEYSVAFTAALPPGTSSIFVDYKSGTTDAQKVKDLFGNILVLPVTLEATVVADTTAPTVEKVEATKANTIEVTFSEDVNAADAQNVANYKLTDANNATVSLSGVTYVAGDKKATITTAANMKAGNYKLEIKNINDKAVVPNKMVTVTKDIAVADKVAPQVSTVVFDATTNKLIVKFDKDMAQTGLTDLANYGLDVNGTATAFPAGTTASIKDAKTVEITLGKAVTGLDGTTDNLQVSGNLTDNVGNKIGGMAVTKAISAASSVAPAVVAKSAKFIDKETITFEVDTELKKIDSTVTNYIQYDSADVASASYVNQGNKSLVTVKVNAAKVLTDTSKTGITANLVIKTGALESVFGGKNTGDITVNAVDIADKVAPFIVATGTETADTTGNGQIDQLTVKFSEAVLAGSIQGADFSISDGYTVKNVLSIAGTTVVLSLNESGAPDTGATPTVVIAGEIEDLVGNKTSTSAAVAAADKAAPVVAGVAYQLAAAGTYAANDTITITFSEKIDASKIAITDITAAKGAGTNTPALDDTTLTPSTGSVNQLVITLKNSTTALDLVSGNTLTIDKTKVVDSIPNAMAADYVITLP
jgi:hypothetical protein